MTTATTPAKVLDYLKVHAPDIAAMVEKDMTAGDVHATTALGSKDEKKKLLETARNKIKAKAPVIGDPLTEALDKVEWRASIRITKVDPDQMLIFGWASVVMRDGKDVVDKQDDRISVEDIEKAAYDFVLYSRQHGDMHFRKGTGRMVESMVFTPEKAEKGLIGLDPETGEQLFGWFTGWKIDEPSVWAAHKRGERPELSIGGKGERVPD